MATSFNAIPQASETFPMARSLFGRPSKSSYKAAVAQIIRDVKARHGLSNNKLSEILVCDEKTIRNAEDASNGCLDPVILLNIAYAFGEDAIQPVRQLYLCSPVEEPTIANRLERIDAETRAIRQELAK